METGLQLFDRRAGQDQRVGTDDVIDVGTRRRHRVDADEVGRRHGEAFMDRIAVDEECAVAEFELAELAGERLGLVILELERVENDDLAALRLVAERHLEAKRANLLVQRVTEGAGPGTVRLAAADEDRCLAIAVTGGTAALLATELLAGAGDVAAFAGGASRTTALFELPRNDAVQDVGARIDAEDVVVEVDIGAGLAVDGLNLDLHDQDSCAPSVVAVSVTTVSSTGVSTGASAGASWLLLAALLMPAGSGASGWRGSLT